MGTRSVITLCAGVCSIVGGYVPSLWGAGDFSVTSVLLGFAGGIFGVWLGARLSEDL